jgi:D-3-phosphoglycerate dehydrogenase
MNDPPVVAVADFLTEAEIEQRVLDGIAEVRLLQTTDETEVVRRAADAEAILIFHEIRLTERSLARLPRCKAVIRCGVGVDNIDLRAAGQQGIVVCNVPDYGTEEVADHALMLLLACARRLLPSHEAIRAGGWDLTQVHGAPRLRGQTLGVIGCGRIGTALALRAKALGMRVVAYDPYRPNGLDKALGIERCHRLEDLLPQAKFISLHCPLTRETHHLLNTETLALLPRGAYIINTARGPCIDLNALFAALVSGQVAYAGLDAIEREPLDDERIRRHPRVVLTPHAAFYSVEGNEEMRTKSAQEAERVVRGEPVRNPVNLHHLVQPRCPVPCFTPPDA